MERLLNMTPVLGCISVAVLTATTLSCDAQTPTEAGLVPHQLVVAGFTATDVQLVLERLDDQDVSEAWDSIVSARAAIAAAQSSCLEARLTLAADPANATCRQAADTAQANLQLLITACKTAVTEFEALVFDQVESGLVEEWQRIRTNERSGLTPDLLALDWEPDLMIALVAALVEERRCQRREEEVTTAAASLLASARSNQNVTEAQTKLATHLGYIEAIME